jgi:hypothetical protein
LSTLISAPACISARLPGPDHHCLINKYGVMFHEMRASDLVKIDMHGHVAEEGDTSSRRVNAAGFTIHSPVLLAREDLVCVVHTHTQGGIAVSYMQEGLLPLSQHAMKVYGRLAYHGYEGIALDLDERQYLAPAGAGQDGDAITVACEPTRCGCPRLLRLPLSQPFAVSRGLCMCGVMMIPCTGGLRQYADSENCFRMTFVERLKVCGPKERLRALVGCPRIQSDLSDALRLAADHRADLLQPGNDERLAGLSMWSISAADDVDSPTVFCRQTGQ